MAYDIPVAALVLDHQAAAAALNNPSKYPTNYFDDESQDRGEGIDELARLTRAPISGFATEDLSVFRVGVYVDSDFCIVLDSALASKAAAVRSRYRHPLIQTAQLAVVTQFN